MRLCPLPLLIPFLLVGLGACQKREQANATAPAAKAAASNAIAVPPSTGPPKLSGAICGNSAAMRVRSTSSTPASTHGTTHLGPR